MHRKDDCGDEKDKRESDWLTGQEKDGMQNHGHSPAKRIAALLGVILLCILVIATLVVSCMDFPSKDQVFSALLLCDIAVPVFMWVILRFLG